MGIREHRSQRDRRLPARTLRFLASAYDGKERINEFITDDGEVAGQLRGKEAFGIVGLLITKNHEKGLVCVFRPIPGRGFL
jgi:hypothetical protein